jgi:hypothetical protein
MAGFNLFVSYRIEVLDSRLANSLRKPLSDPLQD